MQELYSSIFQYSLSMLPAIVDIGWILNTKYTIQHTANFFCYRLSFLKNNFIEIEFIQLKCVIHLSSVCFWGIQPSPQWILEHFHHLLKKTLYLLAVTSILPPPPTRKHSSVCRRDLPVLGISYDAIIRYTGACDWSKHSPCTSPEHTHHPKGPLCQL